MKAKAWLSALGCAGLVGCATADDAAAPNLPFAGLENTAWWLVEIQSSDDSQGTRRPADRDMYKLHFAPGGEFSAQLDCNRAVGSWRNDIANATGGSLAFGPLAVTRALCPEPTLGEYLERQFPYVRSFTIRDGRLNMALTADGGIIVWEPAAKPQ